MRCPHFWRWSFKPLLLVLASVWVAPTAAAQPEPDYAPRVVVVQFAPEVFFPNKSNRTGLQVFDRRAASYGAHTIERVFPFLDHVQPTPTTRRNLMALRRTYYVRYDANAAPRDVARMLAGAPGVAYAEPVVRNRTHALEPWTLVDPNDPGFGSQTYLRHLRLTQAWDAVKSEDGTPPVVIAVVDGGGEWRHEDLRANVWTNPNEIPSNGNDDDGNGFIDDVHGVNFANGNAADNDPTGLPETPDNALHGTAVTGAASAVTDNGVGIAGAAWNAEIMHVNAGCRDVEFICYGYDGILYAAANGADIINVSWGGIVYNNNSARIIDQVLNLATDLGALVVASAGNSNMSNDRVRLYPARHPRVLSVGATEKDSRTREGLSNYGKLVNVFAPGTGITTTGSDNSYVLYDGTSFASPLVAGVAALVKTRFPNMTPDAVREQVRLTSESMDLDNPGLAGQLGRGYVNALAAIQEPTVPAVRLKRGWWVDSDGNGRILAGDAVTITLTVVNHLADARQLTVGLVGAEPYPFLDLTTSEVDVGRLDGGDSTEVAFEFTVVSRTPIDQQVRFYIRVSEGAHEDEADMFTLRVNYYIESAHESLGALYAATGGDNWHHNDNWDITTVPTTAELGTWYGVVLTENSLTGLLLQENNLTGALPAALGDLRQLQVLWLHGNSLAGVIPEVLGNLTQLRQLLLHNNSLTGVIPETLGNLTQLRELYLHRNSLTGVIPETLGNLTQLQELWLHNTSVTGVIPETLGNLSQLQELYMHRNSLTGVIPGTLGNLTQLQDLWLHNNSLTGEIPEALGSLSQLQRLYLASNNLTGAIPETLGNLSLLHVLSLSGNSLTGTMPPKLGSLSQLQGMYLHSNSLTGKIPEALGNLSRLQQLSLSDNSLTGTIPPKLGSLSQLQGLYLHSNSLTGEIPEALGNLSRLRSLVLSNNGLEGRLPRSLMQLDSLQMLWFGGQDLCAPEDAAFQAWLSGIPDVLGPTCRSLALGGNVEDQTLTMGIAIPPIALPKAVGGVAPYAYTLAPVPPEGLVFDAAARTITGTPTMTADQATYTYTVTDANAMTDSVTFGMEVVAGVSFAAGIADQSLPRTRPIAPLVLPEATGGAPPLRYTLTPTLLAGLTFDQTTRTLSGAPTVTTSTPVPYTYKATDANGSADSLTFRIEVYSPVSTEQESLPEAFEVRGNYPNPFQHATRIVFDLPWNADVSVEVLDMLGRRMLDLPAQHITGGWERSIEVRGGSLPSGLYIYRVHASTPGGEEVLVGRLLHLK